MSNVTSRSYLTFLFMPVMTGTHFRLFFFFFLQVAPKLFGLNIDGTDFKMDE